MNISSLSIILILSFIFSMILSLISLNVKRASIEIVNEMGIGYNLGGVFDCYNKSITIKNPDEQITLCGNPIPNKTMIKNIKKYGLKTIRLPVTWINFIDEKGIINSEWMQRVKEVIDWIIDLNLFCILNLYHDGDQGNWLSEGLKAKQKYLNLWTEIANEFINYDSEHLIFESMNRPLYKKDNDYYDYDTLFELLQGFINTIRNSGGNNYYRLLLISGMNSELKHTNIKDYKIPKDPANKIAISLKYFFPPDYNSSISTLKWGSDADYNAMISSFDVMKNIFINKGIPIIISEVEIYTKDAKDEKEKKSIRQFFYLISSLSSDYKDIMICLWDTSNKNYSTTNYYDRKNNVWYDGKI